MLGIIIGIAAIISIVSTIKGTNEEIKNSLIGAGNNAVNIQINQQGYPLTIYSSLRCPVWHTGSDRGDETGDSGS